MSTLLVATALVCVSAPVERYDSPQSASVALAEEMQTGTLLFSKGDCLAVKVFTASTYTHVAAVVVEEEGPYVYDSMNNVGVRRQSLDRYLRKQPSDVVHVFQPRVPFDERRTTAYIEHLESQLGRPYAIAHHVTGRRTDGVHCAEYVTDALEASAIITANKPPRVSPASLAEGILQNDLYAASKTVHLETPPLAPPKSAGWCSRLWFDTKHCTINCCDKMRGWFLCK